MASPTTAWSMDSAGTDRKDYTLMLRLHVQRNYSTSSESPGNYRIDWFIAFKLFFLL